MAASFFFYDLETSGFNTREARIMQFAGQHTDLNLNPIGQPINELIKLTPDILPEPDAIMVTGITPQSTIENGLTEAEFLDLFISKVALPGTIFVGYNSVRFDDEFMRFTLWRNFYDAYEWQWKDNRSRWDLLDVVRMTRALRPDGIEWPFAPDGKPSNRLEHLTAVNKIAHKDAHDALADVRVTIAVAQLIKTKQQKLFTFLLGMRDKRKVAELVNAGEPFVYTSGKYPSENEKTTVVVKLVDHPKRQGALVYDLRHDPDDFAPLSAKQLADRWKYTRDESAPPRLPVKTLQFNRCPAIAPLNTLDEDSQKRIKLDPSTVESNLQKVKRYNDFVPKLLEAVDLLDKAQQSELITDERAVDGQLYDGFVSDTDKAAMRAVRAAQPGELSGLVTHLRDKRLQALLPLYKARNYPEALTAEERSAWEAYCANRLTAASENSRISRYFDRLQALAADGKTTKNQQYLIEELRLYGESILPAIDA